MSQQHVLVTGGAGEIAAAIIRSLAASGTRDDASLVFITSGTVFQGTGGTVRH